MNPYSNALLHTASTYEASPGNAYRIACRKSAQAIDAWKETLVLFADHIWTRVRRRVAYAKIMCELNSLDDRTLRELGITRNDFDAIASGKYQADPTRLHRNQ